MLTKLIPPQYKALAIAVGMATAAAGGAWAAWKIQDGNLADLRVAKAELSSDLRECEGNTADLRKSVDAQNTKLAEAKMAAERAQEAARHELEQARQRSASLDAQIRDLRRARGETCEDAEQLINEALRL